MQKLGSSWLHSLTSLIFRCQDERRLTGLWRDRQRGRRHGLRSSVLLISFCGQIVKEGTMPVQNVLNRVFLAAVIICAMSVPVAAQSNSPASASPSASASGYEVPPKNILDVMRAPSPPTPLVSPTHDTILLVSLQDYPSISRVATPFLRLAGVRVEPKNHSKHDTPGGYGITPCARDFELVHITDGAQTHIALPAGACPNSPVWSADGKRFAFENLAPEAVELWIGDAKTGEVHRVPGAHLNPMFNGE